MKQTTHTLFPAQIFLLLFLLQGTFISLAQTTTYPIPEEGAVWATYEYDPYENTRTDVTVRYVNDTIVNGMTYSIYSRPGPASNTYSRSQNDSIFFTSDFVNESLGFDFSLEVGDTWDFILGIKTVSEVSYEAIENGEIRKHIKFGEGDDIVWIEGIGNRNKGLSNFYTPVISRTLVCYQNDVSGLVYSNGNNEECDDLISDVNDLSPANYSIYPNPTTDQLCMDLDNSKIPQISIYNAMGQLVLQPKLEAGNCIDVAALQVGIYYLQLQVGTEQSTQKILVQR